MPPSVVVFSSAGAWPCRRAPPLTVFLSTSGSRVRPSVLQHPILCIIYRVVISGVQPLAGSNATSGINYEPRSTLTSQPEECACLCSVFFSPRLRRRRDSAAYCQPRAHCVAGKQWPPAGRPSSCAYFQERSHFFSFRTLSVLFVFFYCESKRFAEFLQPRQVSFGWENQR